MRNLSSLVEDKLSGGDQAKKDLITLKSRPLQISHVELDDLAQFLAKLEKTENELRSQSATEIRAQIRSSWQDITLKKSSKSDSRDGKNALSEKLRTISDRRIQLTHNLRRAAERAPGAMNRLKEIVAGYYADQITERHRLTPYNQASCKREIGLDPQTYTATGEVRTLDLILVADLNRPGLNTGYLGIDTVSKNVTPLLAKLLADDNIDRINKDHPLLKPNEEGGYTKEQLRTILTKLQAYQTAQKA